MSSHNGEDEIVEDSEGETELLMTSNVIDASVRGPSPAQRFKNINQTFGESIFYRL